jgi:hypothetical protein
VSEKLSTIKEIVTDIIDGSSNIVEMVSNPAHYNHGKHEAIDVIEDWSLGFHCGNAIKYIARHKHKENSKQDIEKAIWYLQRYLEKM